MITVWAVLTTAWLVATVVGVRRGPWPYAVDALHAGLGGALVLAGSWAVGDPVLAAWCAAATAAAAWTTWVEASRRDPEEPDVRLRVDGEQVTLMNAGVVPASEVVMALAAGGFAEVGSGNVCADGHWHVGDLAPAASATATLADRPGQIRVEAHGPAPAPRRWLVAAGAGVTLACAAAWRAVVALV